MSWRYVHSNIWCNLESQLFGSADSSEKLILHVWRSSSGSFCKTDLKMDRTPAGLTSSIRICPLPFSHPAFRQNMGGEISTFVHHSFPVDNLFNTHTKRIGVCSYIIICICLCTNPKLSILYLYSDTQPEVGVACTDSFPHCFATIRPILTNFYQPDQLEQSGGKSVL